MKKLLIILIALVTILSGCRYKEGPLISFRSVEKRICGIWQVVEFTSDGVDSLQYYNDSCGSVMQVFWDNSSADRRGTFHFTSVKKNFDAHFHFDGGHFSTEIDVDFGIGKRILGPIGNGASLWKILKLEYKKMKISTSFNGRNYIISFKKE
jgi:hypothetical protein